MPTDKNLHFADHEALVDIAHTLALAEDPAQTWAAAMRADAADFDKEYTKQLARIEAENPILHTHAEAIKEDFRRTLARNKARIEAETDAKRTIATWEHDGVTFYLTES